MKSLKFFLLALTVTVLAAGCSLNPEKVLPKKDGTWNIATQQIVTTLDGSVFSDVTDNDVATLTFNDDGTGTIVDDSSNSTFSWVYNDDREELSMTDDQNTVTTWEVLENKKDYQKWHNFTTATVFGITTTVDITVDLDRIK